MVNKLKNPFPRLTYQFIKIFREYKLPLLSGVLLGISFIPFPVFFMFFSLVPLWLFLNKQTQMKKVLIGSWITQFLATLIGFNWIIYTAHYFGNMNWLMSLFILILFCALVNVFIPLASVIWFVINKKGRLSPLSKFLLLPILFAGLHIYIPAIFPWNMGYPWLWGQLPAAQTAELWGFKFLNLLFYIFNLLCLIFWKHRWDRTGKMALASFSLLFIFLNALGWYLKHRLPKTDASLNVVVIQNNIGSLQNIKQGKFFKNPRAKSLHKIKSLTLKAFIKYYKQKKDIDFILWPEGAYPYLIDRNRKRLRGISKLVQKMKIPLVTGGISKNSDQYSNSMVVLDRKGNIMKPIYDKVKLLAFGEHFPGSQKFPFLLKLFPYFQSNLKAGTTPQVKTLEGTRLGLQICYESLFDDFTRTLALKEAQVLVNITNDSWYGHWQEHWQHLIMTFARAIETRRPLIRATNTGVSSVIYSDGSIQELSPVKKSWYFLYQIPYYKHPPKTLFMKWGLYIYEMFLVFLVLFVIIFEWFYIKKRATSDKAEST